MPRRYSPAFGHVIRRQTTWTGSLRRSRSLREYQCTPLCQPETGFVPQGIILALWTGLGVTGCGHFSTSPTWDCGHWLFAPLWIHNNLTPGQDSSVFDWKRKTCPVDPQHPPRKLTGDGSENVHISNTIAPGGKSPGQYSDCRPCVTRPQNEKIPRKIMRWQCSHHLSSPSWLQWKWQLVNWLIL